MGHYNYKNLPTSIQTVDDVADFARFLSDKLHMSFHTDDPFVDYLDDKVIAEKLDALMDRCFEVCEAANIDIYGIMGWPDEKPYDKISGLGHSETNKRNIDDSIILNV